MAHPLSKVMSTCRTVLRSGDAILDATVLLSLLASFFGLSKDRLKPIRDSKGRTIALEHHEPSETEKRVQEQVLLANAPRLLQNRMHEINFAKTMAELDPAISQEIVGVFIPQLRENQAAEAIIHTSDLYENGKEGLNAALGIWKEVATLQDPGSDPAVTQKLRVQYLDSYNWLRQEDEYLIRRIEKLSKTSFSGLQDLASKAMAEAEAISDKYVEKRKNSMFSRIADKLFN